MAAAALGQSSDTMMACIPGQGSCQAHQSVPYGQVTLSLTGPATLIGQNPFAFGSYGGVGGAFVRSVPGKTGQVTVTARHTTLGSASVQVTVAAARPGRYL